jgi:DNA-directed RNA polymerase subunit RPC12/RpoP
MSSVPRSTDEPSRKARLVCRRCGREAHVGDWSVTERDGSTPRRVVTCPNCGEVLVEQPRFAVMV